MKKHGLIWWLFIGWWRLFFGWWIALLRLASRRTAKPATRRSPEKQNPNTERHRVAGISRRTKEVMALAVENSDYRKTKKQLIDAGLVDQFVYEYSFSPMKAELVPEPDNPHDPKAVKVIVEGQHIGYIKSGSCAHVHKLLQAGQIASVTCQIGGGRCKYLAQDEDDGAYTLESDESPFSAMVTIQKIEN